MLKLVKQLSEAGFQFYLNAQLKDAIQKNKLKKKAPNQKK